MKCQCENCKPAPKRCGRLFKRNMLSCDVARYSSPHFWCQCGAWKYPDALSCEDCWREQEAYCDGRDR